MENGKYCVFSGTYITGDNTVSMNIFPETIGGQDTFRIPVSEEWYSSVGSEIDREFAGQDIIRCFRDQYTDKSAFKPTSEPVNSEPSFGFPEWKPESEDALLEYSSRFVVSPGSPENAEDIKFTVRSDDTFTDNSIDTEDGQQEEGICSVDGSPLACVKFLVKTAIGAAYYILGTETARSDLVGKYREKILPAKESITFCAKDIQCAVVHDQKKILFVEEIHSGAHSVWIRPEMDGVYAYISVYGIIGAKIRLAKDFDTFDFPEDEAVLENDYIMEETSVKIGTDVYSFLEDNMYGFYFTTKDMGWFEREIGEQRIFCMYCQKQFRKRMIFFGPGISHSICPACKKERNLG